VAGTKPGAAEPLQFLDPMAPMDSTLASIRLELEFPLGRELNSARRLFVFVRTNRDEQRSGRRAHDTTADLQTTTAGTSSSPRRKASRKASTTRGSKSVPEPFAITSRASNSDIAFRYGLSLVIES